MGKHHDRIKKGLASERYEFRGIRKDGSTIFLEIDPILIIENKTAVGTRSYLWDISDRKRTELALQESEIHLVIWSELNLEMTQSSSQIFSTSWMMVNEPKNWLNKYSPSAERKKYFSNPRPSMTSS